MAFRIAHLALLYRGRLQVLVLAQAAAQARAAVHHVEGEGEEDQACQEHRRKHQQGAHLLLQKGVSSLPGGRCAAVGMWQAWVGQESSSA